MLMPFGKFKGQPVADLPEWYLRWLADEVDLFGPLRKAVESALGKPIKRPEPVRPKTDKPRFQPDLDTIVRVDEFFGTGPDASCINGP